MCSPDLPIALADPDGNDIEGMLFELSVDGYAIRWIDFDEQGWGLSPTPSPACRAS